MSELDVNVIVVLRKPVEFLRDLALVFLAPRRIVMLLSKSVIAAVANLSGFGAATSSAVRCVITH